MIDVEYDRSNKTLFETNYVLIDLVSKSSHLYFVLQELDLWLVATYLLLITGAFVSSVVFLVSIMVP